METRRKEVGKEIKRARRALRIKSQGALAQEIGVHESSVANAEIGSDRIGESVYEAIERRLHWPIGSSLEYIAAGGQPPWQRATADYTPASDDEPPYEWTAESRQRLIAMSLQEVLQAIDHVRLVKGDEEAERASRAIMRLREEATAIGREATQPS